MNNEDENVSTTKYLEMKLDEVAKRMEIQLSPLITDVREIKNDISDVKTHNHAIDKRLTSLEDRSKSIRTLLLSVFIPVGLVVLKVISDYLLP